jgi:hypothetical protein
MDFINWHLYFLFNKHHFNHIDWYDDHSLTTEERSIISGSIRQFQRGEYSEGKHFIEFSKRMGDPSYEQAISLFIREEQDHSAVLANFMSIHGIPELKKHWLDDVFRSLRKLAGLEGIITVLLTAEMISMVYYKALAKVTQSKLLKAVCKQVLKDEVMHLRFQSQSLQLLYARKTWMAVAFSRLLHRVLMTGTIITVWCCHRRVFRSGNFNLFSFFSGMYGRSSGNAGG